MEKWYKVIRSEIRSGICTSPYEVSHACGFHLHQAKVIDRRTSKTHWFCNKCIGKLGYRDIAHELTQRDKMFWQKEKKVLSHEFSQNPF